MSLCPNWMLLVHSVFHFGICVLQKECLRPLIINLFLMQFFLDTISENVLIPSLAQAWLPSF